MRAPTQLRCRSALLIVVVVGILVGLGAAPVRGGAELPSSSAGCEQPRHVTGDHELRIRVGGVTRTALVHVPRAVPRLPVPLVLAFHGTGGSGPFMAGYSGLSRVADRARFIVVYPSAEATQERWTVEQLPRPGAPDDIAFTRALLDEVSVRQCVDPARVSAVGVSNGGTFAARLGCELSDRVAALVIVAGGFGERFPCRPERAVSVLEIHGTDDPVVPYGGRENAEGSVVRWLAGWVRRDRCGPTGRRRVVAPRVQRTDWVGCRDGAAVSHLRIAGGGHQWPGATPPDPGPASTISAADEAWRFLASRRITGER